MSKKALTKLKKARTQLLINHPFFAQVILETKYKIDNSVDTMATDGRVILINSDFTESISVKETMGVLAHEAMHILGMHHLRQQSREHKKWNFATDYSINDLLTKEGFELPEGALIDSDYAEMASEQVYNKMPKPPEDSQPSIGEVMPSGSLSNESGKADAPDQAKAEEQRVKEMASKAATSAKMQGSLPGSLERMVDDLVAEDTPWYELLRQYMIRDSQDDYSWSHPNRRYIGTGLYMPALHGDNGMGEVVVAIDTSGSIGNRELATFQAQIKAIIEDAHPSKISIMYFDTEVSSVTEFNDPQSTDIDLKPTGGGGTDFRPIFEYLDANDKEPDVLVILTDMCATAPEDSYIDTVWAALPGSNSDTPFGTRVDIDWETK